MKISEIFTIIFLTIGKKYEKDEYIKGANN